MNRRPPSGDPRSRAAYPGATPYWRRPLGQVAEAPDRYDPAVAGFLGRRGRMMAAFAKALDARDAAATPDEARHFHDKAERLAGSLQGTVQAVRGIA